MIRLCASVFVYTNNRSSIDTNDKWIHECNDVHFVQAINEYTLRRTYANTSEQHRINLASSNQIMYTLPQALVSEFKTSWYVFIAYNLISNPRPSTYPVSRAYLQVSCLQDSKLSRVIRTRIFFGSRNSTVIFPSLHPGIIHTDRIKFLFFYTRLLNASSADKFKNRRYKGTCFVAKNLIKTSWIPRIERSRQMKNR